MEYKYAVALLCGGEEKIMGIFDTKEDADEYGRSNVVSFENGLQFCFSSLFTRTGIPRGDVRIYDYYNNPRV
jgi:hypothetical protein